MTLTKTHKYDLGMQVKDKVTGYRGTIVSVIFYINGCIQYGLLPKAKTGDKYPECEYLDEGRIEVCGGKAAVVTPTNTGAVFMRDRPQS